MSHQATFTGRFKEAANLPWTDTAGVATATLTGHFHTMEIRALARLAIPGGVTARWPRRYGSSSGAGRRRTRPGCGISMSGNSRPSSGTAGATWGGPADAPQYASRSVGPHGQTGFARSDFFATMVLADAHLAPGGPGAGVHDGDADADCG
jgi:hypothetical protein